METIKRLFYRPVRLIFIMLGSILLLMGSVLSLYYKQKYVDASPQSKALTHLTEIFADREVLEKHTIFSHSKGTNDASSKLNEIISWGDRHSGSFRLPSFVYEDMGAPEWYKGKVVTVFDPLMDFFQSLKEFDHWNLDENVPGQGPEAIFTDENKAYPDLFNLVAWAQYRLLLGKQDRQIPLALEQVRKLARLCWTTDSPLGTSVAIAILRFENEFVFNLEQEVKWETIPEKDLDQVSRYTSSSQFFADPRLDQDLRNQLLGTEAGYCLIVNEAAKNYLREKNLFMEEYPEAFSKVHALVKGAESRCHSSFYLRMWSDPRWDPYPESNQSLWSSFIMSAPGMRTARSYTILSLFAEFPFRSYDQE